MTGTKIKPSEAKSPKHGTFKKRRSVDFGTPSIVLTGGSTTASASILTSSDAGNG